jgi:hypothetical protein
MSLSPVFKALIACAAIGITASAALASPVFVLKPTEALLEHSTTVGVKIYVDPSKDVCTPGALGFMTKQKHLVICYENHVMSDGDPAPSQEELDELADTVRHELIHAAQYCAVDGGVLFPEYQEQFLDKAQDLGMPILSYEVDEWYSEAEARVLSHLMSEDQVKELLNESCGKQ